MLATLPAPAADAADAAATALLDRRTALQAQLRGSPFGQPLVLASRERRDGVEGEVHAEVGHPYAQVAAVLKTGTRLCEVMLLHLNVHGCKVEPAAAGDVLVLAIGPKLAATAGTLQRMRYTMRVETATANYLRVQLLAAEGPMSTRDYRLVFEAVPVDAATTFIHLEYAYSYGAMARAAMAVYLATAGRSKVGFTLTGMDAAGRPQYVRGERGVLERNVVRYHLALLAYCSVDSSGSARERTEARQRQWFALTERYPQQLHEMELDEYLREKQRDAGLAGG